ncbi:FAD:protein FMN transferase [Candidatus Nitrosacidococcus tergens]|uniref:FAD:protein FMN transferase n=1 Tax=Candidatus Nitrosacidococcus tergens TaxID=553981 RepID=A0A7G1Q873_9GAMM|nr:FAD:protein FMN transferase [Candidatus Nitrosacidococcus tergens]CAB1275028.1 Thiamine biosynthesis lipoprotein ApbE [Candidatus Nitrosacidococcus tergens]
MNFISTLAILVLLNGLIGCTQDSKNHLIQFNGSTMGTRYTIKIIDLPSNLNPDTLAKEITQQLKSINHLLSTYQADSELSQFNQNPSTDWISVSSPLVTVIQKAQEISALTQGAFDITVGVLVNLWGFGPHLYQPSIPTPAQIQAAKQKVNFELLDIRDSPPALKKEQGDMYLDLSGIGKGYGVDQIAELLASKNIHNYLVDIGGEERIKGHNSKDQPWKIAIQQPRAGIPKAAYTLERTSGAIATSGDYQNYFDYKDNRYGHIINPKTGWPTPYQSASVTVLSTTAMEADALATGLYVLGIDKAIALAEQSQIPALFIIQSEQGIQKQASSYFPYNKILK